MPAAEQTVDEILQLLESSRNAGYFGEDVTQLEHALQAAQLARDAGSDAELVLAALLHDIGHLLESDEALRHEGMGVINHDATGGRYLRERGFSERVAALVESHVDAKRFLTATNPAYQSKLSAASTATLALQGGPMSPEEVDRFARDPLRDQKLRLRSWDEQAKRVERGEWQVAPLENYRALLVEHLT